ncbi:MAG: histone [Herminiimonas sp.]|nr:histone [Herminiimonas sp.]
MATYAELQAQIKALQQKAEQVHKDEMSGAIADIKAKMQEYGITLADLNGAGATKLRKTESKPVAPKYRDDATGTTWSGRGKQPKWLAGKDRNKFLISRF